MSKRIASIDVFRGMTMVLMTIVNNPGDWGHIYAPLRHAKWHGCTPTDLVFPFFIFIMGVALSVAHRPLSGLSRAAVTNISARSLRIFLLGLTLSLYSWINPFDSSGLMQVLIRVFAMGCLGFLLLYEFSAERKLWIAIGILLFILFLAFGVDDFSKLRIPGVLQRIGIVYFVIAILYRVCDLRVMMGIGAALLVIYYILMMYVPVPGVGPANLNPETNLAAWIDNALLPGHLWSQTKVWDPEGILSTLPAIATGLAGVLVGHLLKQKDIRYMLITGVVMILGGLLWGLHFPINKALWTSSYVLYTGGVGIVILALLERYRLPSRMTHFFTTWGMNAIFVFFLSGIIPRVLRQIKVGEESLSTVLYRSIYTDHISDQYLSSLAWALGYVVFWSLVLYVMRRRGWYIKV